MSPRGIYVDSVTNTLYIADLNSKSIILYDIITDQMTSSIVFIQTSISFFSLDIFSLSSGNILLLDAKNTFFLISIK